MHLFTKKIKLYCMLLVTEKDYPVFHKNTKNSYKIINDIYLF